MEITRDNWRDFAACLSTDPEVFFPEQGGHDRNRATRICRGCDSRVHCLLEAPGMVESVPGIWGGTGELERRQMRWAGRHTWPKLDEGIVA